MQVTQLILTQTMPILLSSSVSYNDVKNAKEAFLILFVLTIIAFVRTIKDFAEGGFHLGIDQLPWTKLVVCFVLLVATIIMFGRYKIVEKEYRASQPYSWMDEATAGEPQTHFGQMR